MNRRKRGGVTERDIQDGKKRKDGFVYVEGKKLSKQGCRVPKLIILLLQE